MKKIILFVVLAICSFLNLQAQDSRFWSMPNDLSLDALPKLDRDSNPTSFLVYSLNLDALKATLQKAPVVNNNSQLSDVIVSFPSPDGTFLSYRIYEASVMEPQLAASLPDIKSYIGKCIEDPTATMRFSTTIFGLHTMTQSGKSGTSYIDPYTKDLRNYMVYDRANLVSSRIHPCGFVNDEHADDVPSDAVLAKSSNSLYKPYRLAMSCTIEYAAFHISAAGLGGGTLAQKKAAVLAAMVVTVTRVNSVYERDLAVSLILVANNLALINITSDTFDNNNTGNILLSQNQTFIDGLIPTANYDIGHVASTGGGGVASLGCICTDIKAQGVTGLPSPVGDAYDIDFVAHEMGHQFGGQHTFNSTASNCGGGNRSATSSFEPGSGTTIMAYAGICSPDDVQLNSDPYFHARSLIQIMAKIDSATGNCSVSQANNNTPPVVNAGGNFTIPFGTPFVLTGVATDVDNPSGDQLTYCWEHYNFLSTAQALVSTNTGGPNFRSFNPSASPTRYFPKLASILANNLATGWEVMPTVARPLTFSLVVRDNGLVLGGQTQRATCVITLANTGPFKVTSQNTAGNSWPAGTNQNVTWDVAGTTANGINTALVNIKLSTDGGLTFPYTLAENTPNDGNESIVVPTVFSQTGRIKIEAVGNVYFAVNTSSIIVGYSITNTCTTYNFNTTFNLPDGSNSFTTKIINVPTAGIISDVNVTINATHPNLQNLTMVMSRPSGTLLTYFNQQCATNANMNVTFDSQAAPFACASPTVGTYALPNTSTLNSLNGFSQMGNWTFGFKDNVAGNAGSINSIGLEICTQTLAIDTFEFDNFALFPNPNKGSFTVQFDSKSSHKISITVFDLSGRKIFDRQFDNNNLFVENIVLDQAQKGIYLVNVVDGDKKIVKRVVIE